MDRRKTPRDTERLKALQSRLEDVLTEAQSIRAQFDESVIGQETQELRRAVRKQTRRMRRHAAVDPDLPEG
ncbi:MAG TPA: hypothetical protein VFX12_00305 [Vicinamibacterales bacterium]|nr:hypothetical protein [Vicinamibacterales bacterium]